MCIHISIVWKWIPAINKCVHVSIAHSVAMCSDKSYDNHFTTPTLTYCNVGDYIFEIVHLLNGSYSTPPKTVTIESKWIHYDV